MPRISPYNKKVINILGVSVAHILLLVRVSIQVPAKTCPRTQAHRMQIALHHREELIPFALKVVGSSAATSYGTIPTQAVEMHDPDAMQ